jgi:Asp-tRNA(Asn)/Glu-tRNA(Gln) amidotransferase A subunit family amidase
MPNSDLHWLTIADAARLIESCRLSPVELADALTARIESLDPQLNARRPKTRSSISGLTAYTVVHDDATALAQHALDPVARLMIPNDPSITWNSPSPPDRSRY